MRRLGRRGLRRGNGLRWRRSRRLPGRHGDMRGLHRFDGRLDRVTSQKRHESPAGERERRSDQHDEAKRAVRFPLGERGVVNMTAERDRPGEADVRDRHQQRERGPRGLRGADACGEIELDQRARHIGETDEHGDRERRLGPDDCEIAQGTGDSHRDRDVQQHGERHPPAVEAVRDARDDRGRPHRRDHPAVELLRQLQTPREMKIEHVVRERVEVPEKQERSDEHQPRRRCRMAQ